MHHLESLGSLFFRFLKYGLDGIEALCNRGVRFKRAGVSFLVVAGVVGVVGVVVGSGAGETTPVSVGVFVAKTVAGFGGDAAAVGVGGGVNFGGCAILDLCFVIDVCVGVGVGTADCDDDDDDDCEEDDDDIIASHVETGTRRLNQFHRCENRPLDPNQ